MKNIHQEIKKALELLKDIKISEYKIDSVGLSTVDTKEYDQMAEDILKIAEKSIENEHGLLVKLKEPVSEVNFVRVGKPSESIYASVQTDDFSKAQNEYPDAKLVEGDGWKLLEVTLENGKIMISDIFETEYYFPKKDKEESKDAEDSTNLKTELENEKQKRITLMADFQNFQKRVENEKSTWGAMSNMSLINDLLEIHDDLQLAIEDQKLNLEHSKSAIKSAQDKLVEAVKRSGIEKIEVKNGDDFDKEKMEAISTVAVEDENQKGKVIAVISSAYKYANKDFILKAAKVVVGK